MKSSTAGLEKRKPSAKSMSSKSAPTKTSTANSHEMAPFFSIFYRGISSKINRSSSKIELDGQNEQLNITNKKFISTSSSDKPPIIPSALKGAKGNNVGDATLYRRATAPSNIKSRSTVELAKERALAEGKNWRENIEQTKSTINLNNSAPTSPQRQRRWPFNIKGTKTQSQELINSLEQNNRISISSNSLIINNKQKELLPPIPIKRKQGQQQQQQKELPQSCEVFQSIPSSFIIQKSSNLPFQKISVENNFPPPSSSSSPPLFSNSPLLLPFNEKPPLSPSSSLPMSFVQRIRLHKGVRTGKLPVDALKQQTPGFEIGRGERFFGSRRISKKGMPPNSSIYMSADAINELRNDPDYIVEALMAIGDEQPKVARSTPKHSFISQDIKKVNERLSRNCIYKSDVYEKMVNDSLLVCDLLKDHLDNVINGVRAKSPTALSSPFTTPPGSPFMTRSTSLHLNNSTNNKPINRITISISPMAQQAKNNNLIINNNKQNISSSKHNLPLYLTKQQQQSPPLLKITKPSFKEEYITSINSNINTKHLHFI